MKMTKKNSETQYERKVRIDQTENGRRFRSRVVPNKKRDAKNNFNKEHYNGEEEG